MLSLVSIFPRSGFTPLPPPIFSGLKIGDFPELCVASLTILYYLIIRSDFYREMLTLLLSGMKLIMNFIPNHTSNQHAWFEASRKRENSYTDYYIWRNGREMQNCSTNPPNNWVRTSLLCDIRKVLQFEERTAHS